MSLLLIGFIIAAVVVFKKFKLVSRKSLVKGNDDAQGTENKKVFNFKVGPFVIAGLMLGGYTVVENTMSFEVSVVVFIAITYLLSNISMEEMSKKAYAFFEKLDKKNN